MLWNQETLHTETIEVNLRMAWVSNKRKCSSKLGWNPWPHFLVLLSHQPKRLTKSVLNFSSMVTVFSTVWTCTRLGILAQMHSLTGCHKIAVTTFQTQIWSAFASNLTQTMIIVSPEKSSLHLFLFLNRLKKTRMKERLTQKNWLRWLHRKPCKTLWKRKPKSRRPSNSSSSRWLKPSKAAVRRKTLLKLKERKNPNKLLRGE